MLLSTACGGGPFGRNKLGEKVFTSKDITVSWYHVSEITTMHDFVDLTRWDHTKNIMEANPNGIYDIDISGDTVIIKTTRDLLIYDLAARSENCYIKLDTSVTTYQYLKKFNPASAEAFKDHSEK